LPDAEEEQNHAAQQRHKRQDIKQRQPVSRADRDKDGTFEPSRHDEQDQCNGEADPASKQPLHSTSL
jgi:hypothetical protein